MTSPEERLRALDPCPDATYGQLDPRGMAARILERSRRPSRRRAVVLAPLAGVLAAGAVAAGLVATAGSPAALPVLSLSAARGGIAFAAVPAGTVFGTATEGYGTDVPDLPASLVYAAVQPKAVRLQPARGLHLAAPSRAEVYELTGPKDPAAATRALASELGFTRVALRATGHGSYQVTGGGLSLHTTGFGSVSTRPLSWSLNAGLCTAACNDVATGAAFSRGTLTALSLLPPGWFLTPTVAVPLTEREQASDKTNGAPAATSVQLRGLAGTVRRRGAYPLVGGRTGISLLQRALGEEHSAREPTVVLRHESLVYLAVMLRGGTIDLVPAYEYVGSDGLRYIVVAVNPADLRGPPAS